MIAIRQESRPVAWLPDGVARNPATERPFHTFLLKIASRCNLDCGYCYVYSGPDQSWRDRPKFMSREVVTLAAKAIASHVSRHQLTDILVVFHGGEPLLAGPVRLNEYIQIIKSTIPASIEFAIQTNATLLREDILDILAQHQVSIGISLDGDRAANDLNRPFTSGGSSYSSVIKAIELVRTRQEWSTLLRGFLAVIDLRSDPSDVYRGLLDIGAKSFDILLPDFHHDAQPTRPPGVDGRIAYGRWLADLFDCWFDGTAKVELRYFEEIIAMLLGGFSSLEAIGAKSVDLIVIETDGDIEAVDTLKMVGRHVTNIGLNVARDSVDEAYLHPGVYSRMLGYAALCETCQSCSELKFCGGGYLPHRYGNGNGFLNPSVYCDDLKFLIGHIRERISAPIRAAVMRLGA